MPVASCGMLIAGSSRRPSVAEAHDDIAIGVQTKIAGTRVINLTAGIGDLKKAVAVDSPIERAVGLLEGALLEVGLRALDANAQADVDAGRRVLARAVLVTRQDIVAIEQILEVRPVLLEGRSVHVRQIVGDRVELGLQRVHARRCGVESL